MSEPQSLLEATLLLHIRAANLPLPESQYKWHPQRKFRADFCWPERHLIVEVQGGEWQQGRHHRPGGYRADCEKLAEAQFLGYRVLHVTREMIDNGMALAFIERALTLA